MTEISRHWGGLVVGDHGRYNNDGDWSDIWRKILTSDRTVEGVVAGYANELEVTNPAGQTIRVATGMAIVDGKFYESDANEDTLLVAPGAGTDYYSMVLRKAFAAQTVRQTLVGPVNGGPAPAPTQADGVTWDLPLAEVRITNGGVVTVIDERAYAWFETKGAQYFFIPAVGGMNQTDGTLLEFNVNPFEWGWHTIAAKDSYLNGYGAMPLDVRGSMTIAAVVFAPGGGNIRLTHVVYAGPCAGAPAQVDSIAGTVAVAANVWNCLYPIAIVGVDAGEILWCHISRIGTHVDDTATDVYFPGWLVAYTTDGR